MPLSEYPATTEGSGDLFFVFFNLFAAPYARHHSVPSPTWVEEYGYQVLILSHPLQPTLLYYTVLWNATDYSLVVEDLKQHFWNLKRIGQQTKFSNSPTGTSCKSDGRWKKKRAVFYRVGLPICRKVLKIMFWEVPKADWLILLLPTAQAGPRNSHGKT